MSYNENCVKIIYVKDDISLVFENKIHFNNKNVLNYIIFFQVKCICMNLMPIKFVQKSGKYFSKK